MTDNTDTTPQPRLARQTDGKLTIVRFPRRQIDGVAVREMYELAAEVMDIRDVRLLIDLSEVVMVSSGAMGMLVVMKKKFMSVGGQLHIAVPDDNIRMSFEVMNLHMVLKLFGGVDEAREKFKG